VLTMFVLARLIHVVDWWDSRRIRRGKAPVGASKAVRQRHAALSKAREGDRS
jgi:hypothetical protein